MEISLSLLSKWWRSENQNTLAFLILKEQPVTKGLLEYVVVPEKHYCISVIVFFLTFYCNNVIFQ